MILKRSRGSSNTSNHLPLPSCECSLDNCKEKSDKRRLYDLVVQSLCNISESSIKQIASKYLMLDERHYYLKYPLILLCVISSILMILQLQAYAHESQGPLDHFLDTVLWKPYYGLFCPDFSFNRSLNFDRKDRLGETKSIVDNNSVYFSWDCNEVLEVKSVEGEPNFPLIFMIGARGERENTFKHWKENIQSSIYASSGSGYRSQPHLKRIDTLKISNDYVISRGALQESNESENSTMISPFLKILHKFPCQRIKWEHRLFAVYQSVFHSLLTLYPHHPGFVILEDDALLVNQRIFVEEICHAQNNRLEFYSLYRSPLQLRSIYSVSCIFQHGTVAFYIRRSMMERIVQETRRGWFCRFPIDMYISKLGPWYATMNEVVSHKNSGRIGSTG